MIKTSDLKPGDLVVVRADQGIGSEIPPTSSGLYIVLEASPQYVSLLPASTLNPAYRLKAEAFDLVAHYPAGTVNAAALPENTLDLTPKPPAPAPEPVLELYDPKQRELVALSVLDNKPAYEFARPAIKGKPREYARYDVVVCPHMNWHSPGKPSFKAVLVERRDVPAMFRGVEGCYSISRWLLDGGAPEPGLAEWWQEQGLGELPGTDAIPAESPRRRVAIGDREADVV